MTARQVMFWVFFAVTIAGALGTVTRRNAVAAVMCLVLTFFGLAAEFLLLAAPFLAALQVLVYAGAIMVLFVFVVMIVSRGETFARARFQGLMSKLLGTAALGFLVYRGILTLRMVRGEATEPAYGFGSISAVGRVLLSDFMFPFEAISLLLLVAVVGALVIARQHHDKREEGL